MAVPKQNRAEQRNRRQTKPKLRAVDSYSYIRCKVLRHSFEPVGPIANRHKTKRTFGTLVTFRCEHCAGLRFDVVSRLTGDLLYRWYEMADDYSTEKQSMAYWRVAMLDEMDNTLLEDLEDE